MKILHTADIHLGAKNGKLPLNKQTALKTEQLKQIERLFALADENYDVMLICGDLFHSKSVTNKIKTFFFDCVKKYNKPVVYVNGNHDENFDFSQEIPSNFVILNENRVCYEYQNVVFYGQVDSDLISERFDKNKTNILLLHGNIEESQDNDFVDVGQYVKLKFDYVAMGHIHSFKAYEYMKTPYVYSGSLLSNGFDECGNKGFVSLEVEGKDIKYNFVPFAERKYVILQCDISNCYSFSQIKQQTKDCLEKNASKNDIIKLQYIGFVDEDSIKDFSFISDDFQDYFYIEVEDKTKIKIDIEKIKNEKFSFKAEFISLIEESSLSEEEKQKICKLGLEALKGEDLSI